ncbi:hypothetical protein FRB99_005178 [Tulasnella sp. 403]|nr:hypothetical protein FRB99_005178 [Tulasnella sp. 403]
MRSFLTVSAFFVLLCSSLGVISAGYIVAEEFGGGLGAPNDVVGGPAPEAPLDSPSPSTVFQCSPSIAEAQGQDAISAKGFLHAACCMRTSLNPDGMRQGEDCFWEPSSIDCDPSTEFTPLCCKGSPIMNDVEEVVFSECL